MPVYSSYQYTGRTFTLQGGGSINCPTQDAQMYWDTYGLQFEILGKSWGGQVEVTVYGTTPLITLSSEKIIQTPDLNYSGNPFPYEVITALNAYFQIPGTEVLISQELQIPSPGLGAASWGYLVDCDVMAIAGNPLPGGAVALASLRPKIGGRIQCNIGPCSINTTIPSYDQTNDGGVIDPRTGYLVGMTCGFPFGRADNYDPSSEGPYHAGPLSISGQFDGYNLQTPLIVNPGNNLYNPYGEPPVYGVMLIDFTEGISVQAGPNASIPVSDFNDGGYFAFLPGVFNNHWFYGGSISARVPVVYSINAQVATVTGSEPSPLKAIVQSALSGNQSVPQIITLNPSASANIAPGMVSAGWGPPQGYPTLPAYYYLNDSGSGVQVLWDAADPVTALETKNDQRYLEMRLPVYDGPTLSIGRHTLDPCNSATNWTGVTLVGGSLQIDTSVNAQAQATYPVALVSEQGRYLIVRIKSPSNSLPFTLKIQSQAATYIFNGVTGLADVEQDISFDLCAASPNATPSVSPQLSRFPTTEIGYSGPWTPSEGVTWGINRIQQLTLLFEASTGIYDIIQIAISQTDTPIISIAQSTCSVISYIPPDPHAQPGPVYQLGIWSDADGRRILEYPWLIPTTSYAAPPYFNTVADLQSYINGTDTTPEDAAGFPAWTISPYTPSLAWYANDLVGWMGGNGAIVPQNGPSVMWFRKAWNQSQPIPMQLAVTQFWGFPNCGDILGDGMGSSGAAICRIFKLLRGTFNGVEITYSGTNPVVGTPASGVLVTSTQGSSDVGDGTSDAAGIYQLGSPGALDSFSGVTTIQAAGGQPTTRYSPYLRFDERIVTAPGGGPAGPIFEHVNGSVYVAMVNSAKQMTAGWARHPWPIAGFDRSGIVASGVLYPPSIWVDQTNQMCWIAYMVNNPATNNHDIYTTTSSDRTSSWTTPVLFMSSASYPKGRVSKGNGATLLCWIVFDSGTSGPATIYSSFKGRGQINWSTPQAIVDNNGNPIKVSDVTGWGDVDWGAAGNAPWVLFITAAGDSSATYWLGDRYGRTWLKQAGP